MEETAAQERGSGASAFTRSSSLVAPGASSQSKILLWLPPEYRPRTSTVAVAGATVAMGCDRGRLDPARPSEDHKTRPFLPLPRWEADTKDSATLDGETTPASALSSPHGRLNV